MPRVFCLSVFDLASCEVIVGRASGRRNLPQTFYTTCQKNCVTAHWFLPKKPPDWIPGALMAACHAIETASSLGSCGLPRLGRRPRLAQKVALPGERPQLAPMEDNAYATIGRVLTCRSADTPGFRLCNSNGQPRFRRRTPRYNGVHADAISEVACGAVSCMATPNPRACALALHHGPGCGVALEAH